MGSGVSNKRCGKLWKVCAVLLTVCAVLAWSLHVEAIETTLGGQPLAIQGYLKQSTTYGVGDGNQIESQRGFNSFVTEALLEMQYQPKSNWKFFVSGKGNVDWAYPVLAGNNEWKEKQFDKAYSKFFVFDYWQDILGEAHVTYAKDNLFLRFGKQVVVWGEADGFRLMDQINPIDQRRGIANVNFENVVIPVWLLRAEYRQPTPPSWLQDLGYQFVFNPNFGYRGNEGPTPGGTDTNGIWYMDKPAGTMRFINFPPGAPVGFVPSGIVPTLPPPFQAAAGPNTGSIIGSFDSNLEKPAAFSSDGYKYSGRVTATIADTRITLNGFYGRDNNWVFAANQGNPRLTVSPFNGTVIVHAPAEIYFPLFKFVGATLSRDLSFLRSEALGGVSPVLRAEAIYAFNSTFGKAPLRDAAQAPTSFEKHDEVRWLVGMDWKVKIPALNDKAYFTVSPQIYNRHIMNFKDDGILVASDDPYIRENTWITTLNVMTSYFHNKLQPSLFWMRDWSNHAWLLKPELAYERNSTWKYALGAIIVDGDKEGEGLWCLRHKDQIYASVTFRF